MSSSLSRIVSKPTHLLLIVTAQILFAFIDPCSLPEHPGWPLRNLLALLKFQGLAEIQVLCYREQPGTNDISQSLVLTVQMPGPSWKATDPCPKEVGWEKNQQGKLAPRMIDLSATMDSNK